MGFIKKHFLIIFISIFTLIYLLAIAIDISPNIRGPYDPNLDYRIPYYFVNTMGKLWMPLLIFLMIIFLFLKFDNKKKLNHEFLLLIGVVILGFLLHISFVYFSRFDIPILFRRMVHPGINGYFSTAIEYSNIMQFMRDYPKIAYGLDQHAASHPPGPILFIHSVIALFNKLPLLTESVIKYISQPDEPYTKQLWLSLTQAERVAALAISVILHFLSVVTVIPLYFIARRLLGEQVAIRTIFLYILTPGVAFFALLFDPLYALFPILSIFLLLEGITKKSRLLLTFAGIIMGIALFFSFSVIPVIVIVFLFSFLMWVRKKDYKIIKQGQYFVVGFVLWHLLLYSLGYNVVSSFFAGVSVGSHMLRSYSLSLLANPYEFFLFLGIPTSFIFLNLSYLILRRKIHVSKSYMLGLLAFWLTFVILTLSGRARGEVGRIWVPLMFVPIIFSSFVVTKYKKYSSVYFAVILFLLFLQIIVIQEFWVPVW